MNRAVEQSLASLLPRLNGDLPTPLVELASSLVTQSRHKASNLKGEEEIGRTYACAHIACERLKTPLNLPPIEPRPPVAPRIYNKLYKHLSDTLVARARRTPKKAPAREEQLPSPTPKTPTRRKPTNPSTTSASQKPLPSRATPTKERALAAFRSPNKSRRSEVSHGGRQFEIAAWIPPVVRALCAALEAKGAVPHVLAGVTSVLTLPTPKPEGRGPEKRDKVPALVAALYILVRTRLLGKETSGKEYVVMRRSILAVLNEVKADEAILAKVAAIDRTDTAWEGWEDVVGKDIDRWLMDLSARGWVELDWFNNIVSGAGVDVPEQQGEEMEGLEYGEEQKDEEEAPEEEDGEEEGPLMGLGTMMQDRVDYLSARKREEYQIWKEDIMARVEKIEKAKGKS